MGKYVDSNGLKHYNSKIAEIYPTATEVDEAIDLSVSAAVADLQKKIKIDATQTSASASGLTLQPNVFYRFGTKTTLGISTFATPSDDTIYNEYMFEFESGTTATTLSLPSSVLWANGEVPSIEANMMYHVSVVNNLATIVGFPMAGIVLALSTDGTDIFVELSRSLAPNEKLLLMRCGRQTNRTTKNNGDVKHYKGKYRWHVDNQNVIPLYTGNGKLNPNRLELLEYDVHQTQKGTVGVLIQKAGNSRYFHYAATGLEKKVTFACAVFKDWREGDTQRRPRRVSNVAYFTSNVRVNVGEVTNPEDLDYTTWFAV